MATPEKRVSFIPEGYHTATPYLRIRDAARALDWYKTALGAVERFRMPSPDGTIGHAEIQIGDSMIMMGEEMPQMGCPSPQTLGGTSAGVMLYVENVDAAFQQAVSAGAKVTMPVENMFWGDRYGKFTDPFGHEWSVATHVADLTPEEIEKGAQAFYAAMGQQQKKASA